MTMAFHTASKKPFTKSTAFLGITIDGHIAREDGSIDYLPPAPTSSASTAQPTSDLPTSHVLTITAMLATSSVLVLGRNTYTTCLTLPDWPYGAVPLIVLSSAHESAIAQPRSPDIPRPIVLASLDDFISHCAARTTSYERVWIDGGATVRNFIEAGLLDEMILTTVPVVLGRGISLFGGLKREIKCEVVGSEVVEGLVATRWKLLYGEVDENGGLKARPHEEY
jgi:dihydrofolate reductase